jgi:CheY-like chemotaxis protein
MSKTGPIIIIDDDPDDQEMIHRVISKMNLENEVKKFFDGEDALRYLLSTQDRPMLILCDINMPLLNGLEFKQNIESNSLLKKRAIPFVFLTTTANPDQIARAYSLCVQGFFNKGQSYNDLKERLHQIIGYWKNCEQPF